LRVIIRFMGARVRGRRAAVLSASALAAGLVAFFVSSGARAQSAAELETSTGAVDAAPIVVHGPEARIAVTGEPGTTLHRHASSAEERRRRIWT
jgi:hypothetical protein